MSGTGKQRRSVLDCIEKNRKRAEGARDKL